MIPRTDTDLVWIDVETTGLDPARDWLLEVAVAVTDTDLNMRDGRAWVVGGWPEGEGGYLLSKMSPEVTTMHGGSGLLAEVARADASTTTVDRALRQWLSAPRWTPSEKDGFVMCGSSVHFDREFVRRCLPRSFELFGHRIVDVSTVKTMVKMWWPDLAYDSQAPKAHRAALDIQASIGELRYYRSLMKVFEPATES